MISVGRPDLGLGVISVGRPDLVLGNLCGKAARLNPDLVGKPGLGLGSGVQGLWLAVGVTDLELAVGVLRLGLCSSCLFIVAYNIGIKTFQGSKGYKIAISSTIKTDLPHQSRKTNALPKFTIAPHRPFQCVTIRFSQ